VLEPCAAAGTPASRAAAGDLAARVLLSREGLVAFLGLAACRDDGLLRAVEAECARWGAPPSEEERASLRTSRAEAGRAVGLVLLEGGGKPARTARAEGGAAEPTPADVALGLLEAIAAHDAIDEDLAEARVVLETLKDLTDPHTSAATAACFLFTKAASLRYAAAAAAADADGHDPSDARDALAALSALEPVGRAVLDGAGVSIEEVSVGDDLRRHVDLYRQAPGSVGSRITAVIRPCLRRGGQVVQLGIVDTAE
jgi:hypothetical protein